MSAAGAGAAKPKAKRARVEETVPSIADEVLAACPPTVDETDFASLARLKDAFAGNPHLRLLPMPPAAYSALKLEPPRVASMTEVAINCFAKPLRETYSSNEVEVRDLRETHTAADFPVFYTGPAHPHMHPEGGIRVENKTPAAPTAADDGDDEMRGTVTPGCAGGFTVGSNVGAAAGAGAWS